MTYQRLMSSDFLKVCSIRTAALYRYWEAKKGGRALPRRADIDPADMKPWLSGLVLVDVTDLPERRITYRVVGTSVCAHRGFDPTGRPVQEGLYGNVRNEVLENYRIAIDEKTIVFDYDPTPSRSGFAREIGTLFLPLSSDGVRVDKILIYQDIEPTMTAEFNAVLPGPGEWQGQRKRAPITG
ncbi:PAS domain-containing protein [Dongia sp.]|uniref:PAS domain-containing protein n=1 Tax=Dongia sp. TaxID=1977262 RepID=UPI0035B097FA